MIILTVKESSELNLPDIDCFELRNDRIAIQTSRPFLATGFYSKKATMIDVPYPGNLEKIKEQYPSAKVIYSYHGTPHSVEEQINNMDIKGVDYIKIVLKEVSFSTFIRYIPLLKASKERLILFVEGEEQSSTRILSYMFGAKIIFTSTDGFRGQIPYDHLIHEIDLKRLGKSTKILGILRGKMARSRGESIYNGLYKKAKIDAIYLPFVIDQEEIKMIFESDLFYGLSITMPLKVKAFEVARKIDPDSLHCHSINTWHNHIGYNTDRFVIDLLGDISGKKCVIIGAGGAAIALGAEAKKRKADVTFYVRNVKKGRELLDFLELEYQPLENLPHSYDILIDATSEKGVLKRIDLNAKILDVKIDFDERYLKAKFFISGETMFNVQAKEQLKIFGFQNIVWPSG